GLKRKTLAFSGDGGALFALAFTSVIALIGSSILGPFLIIPALATLNLAATIMHLERHRPLACALACAPIALPVAAEALGLLRPSYAFDDRGMLVLANTVALRQGPTTVLLLVLSLTTVAFTGALMTRFRTSLSRLEERLTLQAWQLRQIAPSDEPERKRAAGR